MILIAGGFSIQMKTQNESNQSELSVIKPAMFPDETVAVNVSANHRYAQICMCHIDMTAKRLISGSHYSLTW